MDPSIASAVVRTSECLRIEAGDVLFAEGDPPDAGYVVVSGRLMATRDGVRIGEVGRGEVVGEIGLIERSPRIGDGHRAA